MKDHEYDHSKDFIPFIGLLARVSNDGYLIKCTDDVKAGVKDSFWKDKVDLTLDIHPEWLSSATLIADAAKTYAIEVPEDMYLAMTRQGTMEQMYPDGYIAWLDVIALGTVNTTPVGVQDD